MPGCKLDVICKHFVPESFTECVRKNMCKFFDEGDKAVGGGSSPKEKRHYKKRAKPDPDDDSTDIGESKITPVQYESARKKIANAKYHDKLNENQVKALESLKGLRFKTMAAAQSEGFIRNRS